MSAIPIPASDPSRPAPGIVRWMAPPTNDMPTLKRPIRIMQAMPTCHAEMAASCAGMRALAAR